MEERLQESISSLLKSDDLLTQSHNVLRKEVLGYFRVSRKVEESFELLTEKADKMERERENADQKARENIIIFGLKDDSDHHNKIYDSDG